MHLADPLPGTFTYVAWRAAGPRPVLVPRSSSRRALLPRLEECLAAALPADATLRLFEATSIAPVPGRPTNDVIALVNSTQDVTGAIRDALADAGLPPELILRARNVARFGDTEAHPGPILLNHFVGTATPSAAAEAWSSISNWYASTLGVDNSTLLQFEPGAPFVITNYVGIPTPVPTFMAGQLLRPSFYRRVAAPLAKLGLRACPVFARRVPLGVAAR